MSRQSMSSSSGLALVSYYRSERLKLLRAAFDRTITAIEKLSDSPATQDEFARAIADLLREQRTIVDVARRMSSAVGTAPKATEELTTAQRWLNAGIKPLAHVRTEPPKLQLHFAPPKPKPKPKP